MVRKNSGEALSQEAAAMRSLAREIGLLQGMNLAELQACYRSAFGEEAKSKNLPFLRKKIAYRMQEALEGGLPEPVQKRIQELAPTEMKGAPRPMVSLPAGLTLKSIQASARQGSRDPRLPAPGTVLTREFRGLAHEVEVLAEGFRYRGRAYASLSAIAREITGTPWNGFLFFGLIRRGGADAQ